MRNNTREWRFRRRISIWWAQGAKRRIERKQCIQIKQIYPYLNTNQSEVETISLRLQSYKNLPESKAHRALRSLALNRHAHHCARSLLTGFQIVESFIDRGSWERASWLITFPHKVGMLQLQILYAYHTDRLNWEQSLADGNLFS